MIIVVKHYHKKRGMPIEIEGFFCYSEKDSSLSLSILQPEGEI